MLRPLYRPALLACAAALLSACGGGGGGDASPPAAAPQATLQGTFDGTLQGARATSFSMLVLDTGQYWALYGNVDASGDLVPTGFIEGTGTVSGNIFNSGDLRDFGTRPATAGTVGITFTTDTITGSGVEGAGPAFTLSGNRTTGFAFTTPAAVSDVAGTWTASGQSQFTISTAGAVSGTSSGCAFSGTIAPHGQVNAFDVSVTFGGAPCALPGQTASGIAIDQRDAASGRQAILVALVSADRTEGAVIAGVR